MPSRNQIETASFLLLVKSLESFSCTEKERHAPDTCKRNDSIYYSASEHLLSSEYPCNYIKTEKPNASPVQCSYDRDNKRNSIHYHCDFSSFLGTRAELTSFMSPSPSNGFFRSCLFFANGSDLLSASFGMLSLYLSSHKIHSTRLLFT